MSELTRKEQIQQFRSQTSEADFIKLKERVSKGELSISIGRDKSRTLLKKTQATYYYTCFGLALALAGFTIYTVGLHKTYLTGFGFATTIMVFIVFWRSMTKRMSAWSMEEKNNFDYAYFSNVVSIKAGDKEFNYPEEHWKEALEE